MTAPTRAENIARTRAELDAARAEAVQLMAAGRDREADAVWVRIANLQHALDRLLVDEEGRPLR